MELMLTLVPLPTSNEDEALGSATREARAAVVALLGLLAEHGVIGLVAGLGVVLDRLGLGLAVNVALRGDGRHGH